VLLEYPVKITISKKWCSAHGYREQSTNFSACLLEDRSGRHAVGRPQGFHSIRVLGAAPAIYAQGEAATAKCEAQRGDSEG